jgi:predicted ester cyclase
MNGILKREVQKMTIKEMTIRDIAEKFIAAENAAWLEGNVDALDNIDMPDVVYHLMPPSPDVVGREMHKQLITSERKAFTNIKLEWKYLTGEGNIFVVFYNQRRMFTGKASHQPPPTGKRATRSEICVCRLKNGKIAEAWFAGSSTGINETFCI